MSDAAELVRSSATAMPAGLDNGSERAIAIATEIGLRAKHEIPVSFTTLLASLLFVSTDFYERLAEASPSSADAIFNAAGTNRNDLAAVAKDVDTGSSGVANWTVGDQLMTASATQMLDNGRKRTAESGSNGALVTTRDVLAGYIFDVPAGRHQKEMADWGFTADVVERLKSFFAAATPAPAEGASWVRMPITGFDSTASAILYLGRVLARHRTPAAEAKTPNTASTLMVAMADAGRAGIQLPEVAALRDVLGADTDSSVFSQYRDASYELPNETLQGLILSEADQDPPRESTGLASICEEAAAIASLTGGDDALIAPRHLAAALILTRDGEINEESDWLVKHRGLKAEAWRDRLRAVIVINYQTDDKSAWARILIGPRLVANVQPDTIPEDPRASDALGLRRYSDAIAMLIASKGLRPPLSIAVFGAWGAGKSFFMRMIRRGIDGFVQEAADGPDPEKSVFLSQGIVHIDFNAWHYAEENLWASLVQAILVGIDKRLSPVPEPPVFQQVLENLVSRERAEAAATAQLKKAEAELRQRSGQLAAAELEASKKRAVHAQLAADDVLVSVRRMAIEKIFPAGGGETDRKKWIANFSDSIIKAAEIVGRPELAENLPELRRAAATAADAEAALATEVGQIEDVVSELQKSERRGLALLAWLSRQQMEPTERRLLIRRILIWLVPLVIVTAFMFLATTQTLGGISLLASLAVSAGAAVKPIVASVSRRLDDANQVFGVLENLKGRIEKRQQERLAQRDQGVKLARLAIEEAEVAVTRDRAAYEAAREAVADAREVVRTASNAEQMKRFIGQRLEDGDYLRRLGLIHTINVDLERLQALLKKANEAASGGGTEGPAVTRIVLYIDDLDRCPPKRVVEVLEAVHLLLAFELFVVVVGVDIRWVQQALKKRYPKQLTGIGGIASPMDYLEKVFQIPFWLPAMEEEGGATLLAAAIGPVAPRRPAPRRQEQSVQPGAPVSGPLPVAPPSPGGTVPLSQQTSSTTVTAEALQITPGEFNKIRELAGAIGISPRRAKRFANLYRILKASLSVTERADFVLRDGEAGGFRAAMILLAMTTGAPHAAAIVLNKLTELNETEPDPKAAFLRVLDDVQPSEEEKSGYRAAVTAAAEELEANEGTERADVAEATRRFRFWAPRIRRFAFDTDRV
jgi:hypothetical protein